MAVLEDALQWAGTGAKTAAGYGRMSPDCKANSQQEKQRQKRVEQSQPQETRLTWKIKGWSEIELAERFGTQFNKTKEQYGEEFNLLFDLAKQLRAEDIESWHDISKKSDRKGDKDRNAAYRKFNPANLP